jgi:transcriptional regulator with XRE-family HTH domain
MSAPEVEEFKDRLRHALAAVEMSQAELGRRISAHSNLVGNWVRGERYPSFHHLAALAPVLGVDVDWLVLGRGELPPSRNDARLGERVRRLAPELIQLVELARESTD